MTTVFKDEVITRAHEAIRSPEVQALVQQLAKHNLGVFMPHIHDQDGDFQPMPPELVAVEDGLVLDFRARESIDVDSASTVPVGWVWQDGVGVVAQQYCIPRAQKHISSFK